MAKRPIATWCFALVVVRLHDRFLLVQEAKHGSSWYLPAGRMEPGESFVETARRETLEEAGIEIEPTSVFRIEHTPNRHSGEYRMRVFFRARPVGDTTPKSRADDESLGAGWFTLDQVRGLPLRAPEVLHVLEDIAAGRSPEYPLEIFSREH